MSRALIELITVASIVLSVSNGARILAVFPHPSHSHQVVFKALSMELAKRGHEVVIFTTHPDKGINIQNYTQVDMHFLNDNFKKQVDFFKTGAQGIFSFLNAVYEFVGVLSDQTLSHPVMQKFISPNSTEKFDLILVQCLYYDALYALSVRFDAPMIGMSSLPLMSIHHYMFGNPLLTAYSPDPFLGCTDNMDLWDRIVNLYYFLRQIYEYEYVILPKQEAVVRKHFGNSMPPARELSKNLNLLFVSTHPYFIYPRSNVPSIMHIGGMRSGNSKNSLPEDLKKILDDSKKGFIYFSLGSNLKSSQLPTETRDTLLATFAELPYTVIWKFEADATFNKSANVIIQKWLPQREILAHPNIVLFIYQGGLQSTEEAVDNAVPLIGFPIFSDQISNVRKLQNYGIAKKLDFTKLRKETFKSEILDSIENTSYKKNALKLRDLLRDLPQHPMEHAIWWTEHVIRHKRTPHLWNRSREMPWYKVELLDIAIIFVTLFLLALYISFVILRWTLKKILRITGRIDSIVVQPLKKQE